MHLPEPSIGGDVANLLHASAVTKSSLADVRNTVPVFLLQPVWSAEHLRVLKVKERTEVPVSAIFNRFHLPRPGNNDFEELTSEITLPSSKSLLDLPKNRNNLQLNTFSSLFSSLHEMSKAPRSHTDEIRYITAAKAAIATLIETVLPYIDDEGSLRLDLTSFPFHLKRIAVKGVLPCDGCLIKTDMQGLTCPVPVAAISIARSNDHEDIEAQEAAQLVLQAALAFEQNLALTTYKAFVIHLHATSLQVVSANIPRVHLDRLYQGKPCLEGFEVLHSEMFDMLEIEGRRETLRIVFGLLKSLRTNSARKLS